MDYFLLIIALITCLETTFLTFQKFRKTSSKSGRIYLDTSALMDGRIVRIAETGIISDQILIPTDVLHELQLLADGKDAKKRSLARFGLENANKLERTEQVDAEVIPKEADALPKVDDELLRLAKNNRAKILTLDYNLIKLANAEKIQTINLNDLAIAARKAFLPGEIISVKIADKGSSRGQGVAYLKDSTMIVVSGAADKIGQTVDIELVKLRETSSGRMIFAKLAKK